MLELMGSLMAVGLPPPLGLRVEHMGGDGVLGVDTASPRLSWTLPLPAGQDRGRTPAAYHAQIAGVASPAVVWDSGAVTSSSTMITVAASLAADTRYEARVRWRANDTGWSPWASPLRFSTGLFGPGDWHSTVWLDGSTAGEGVTQLRGTFAMGKPAAAARLYVAGTGYHRCWIDGRPVSDVQLGHHTTYEARVLYDTFDVTALLGAGGRTFVLACELAAGWYGITAGPGHGAGVRGIRLLLSVEHPDGTRTLAGSTDAGVWRRTDSPYRTAGIFSGIMYDQRMAIQGWRLPGYRPTAPLWQDVAEFDAGHLGPLTSALHPPIRTTEAFPASVVASNGTSFILDFEQNAAGMLNITIPAAGSRVGASWLASAGVADTPCEWRFAFSERQGGRELGPQSLNVGDVVFTSTAGWLASNSVIFQPGFSYGGFRSSRVTFSCGSGATAAAAVAAVNPVLRSGMVVSLFTHTDLEPAGAVEFNLPLLNQVQRATMYTSLSNLMDMPTDCPTRERAGWTGDGQLTSPTVSYNFQAGALYRKWLRDIGDAQRFFRAQCMGTGPPFPDSCDCKYFDCTGEVPPSAPWYLHGFHGGRWPGKGKRFNVTMPGTDPAWGMAYTVIAHLMLDWYGDLRAVEEQYAGLVRYMKYLRGIPGVNPVVPPFNVTGLLTYNVFGDWDRPGDMPPSPPVHPSSIVPPPGNGARGPPSPMIASWAYITQLRKMTEIADALGHSDDAARFAADAARSSKKFVAAFLRGDTFGDGTLTQMSANSLALDLFPAGDEYAAGLSPAQREVAVHALVRAVIAAGNRSDAGIISASTLYPVMSHLAAPAKTLAVAINVGRSYPSFGYELAQNATTLWEKWDGGHTSHNHIMVTMQPPHARRPRPGLTCPAVWHPECMVLPRAGGNSAAPRGPHHVQGQRLDQPAPSARRVVRVPPRRLEPHPGGRQPRDAGGTSRVALAAVELPYRAPCTPAGNHLRARPRKGQVPAEHDRDRAARLRRRRAHRARPLCRLWNSRRQLQLRLLPGQVLRRWGSRQGGIPLRGPHLVCRSSHHRYVWRPLPQATQAPRGQGRVPGGASPIPPRPPQVQLGCGHPDSCRGHRGDPVARCLSGSRLHHRRRRAAALARWGIHPRHTGRHGWRRAGGCRCRRVLGQRWGILVPPSGRIIASRTTRRQ